ncbi:MAG TPA: hypothetical protein VHZ09_13705 [Acidobacteriaceae bacterium]|nr:hypothetical protein [Acidobacteriaceae bacterium]
MEDRILSGWKEIGSYLDRAVRTVQRWELRFGMPIHRPARKRRTAVIAFPGELNAWLSGGSSRTSLPAVELHDDPVRLREALVRLQHETQDLAVRLWRLERDNTRGREIDSSVQSTSPEAHWTRPERIHLRRNS